MKITKKKIVVSALTLLVGASLAGSISGTVAWYQYSTRANGAYLGASGGTAGNLQMRIKGEAEWLSRLTKEDVNTYLTANGYASEIQPITAGGLNKDDALPQDLYLNPVAGFGPYSKWLKASKANYLQIPLELRYVERDGQYKTVNNKQVDDEEVERNVYLSDLKLQDDKLNAKKDLSDALRFHVYSYQSDLAETGTDADLIKDGSELNRLVSKNGGTTVAQGKLDLDGDGKFDKGSMDPDDEYGFHAELVELIYGRDYPYVDANGDPVGDDSIQTSYHARKDNFDVVAKASSENPNGPQYFDQNNAKQDEQESIYPAVVESNSENLNIAKLSYKDDAGAEHSKAIGKTIAKDPTAAQGQDDYLNVVLTVWVEGWQKFEETVTVTDDQGQESQVDVASSIWSADYIDSVFNVGFQFAIDPAE